MTKHQVKTDTA